MALDLQYSLTNLTPADASPVEANFNRTEQYINTELIDRAGTTAMTGQLKLLGDPVAALDAAPKQYVDSFMPIGSIVMYGGDTAPTGGKWALCNGADMDAALYPALYAVVGNKYGGTGGAFKLPNLAGKFPLGVGTDSMGATGGSRDAAVVNHTHPVDHTHGADTTGTDSPDHSHNDDHAHSGTTAGANARHHHPMRGTGDPSAPGGLGEGNITDASNAGFGVFANTGDDTPDHAHVFNTNAKSTQGYGTNTGGASARHAHSIPALAFTGPSGNPSTGVAPTNVNMPPYIVVNFLIRVA